MGKRATPQNTRYVGDTTPLDRYREGWDRVFGSKKSEPQPCPECAGSNSLPSCPALIGIACGRRALVVGWEKARIEAIYGYCPQCGQPGIVRARDMVGTTGCAKGHEWVPGQAAR